MIYLFTDTTSFLNHKPVLSSKEYINTLHNVYIYGLVFDMENYPYKNRKIIGYDWFKVFKEVLR